MLSQQSSGACNASHLLPNRLVQSIIVSGSLEVLSFKLPFLGASTLLDTSLALKGMALFEEASVAVYFILKGNHRLH